MILNNAENILIGNQQAEKVYLGTIPIWENFPAEYQKVEYLESTGTQYINSNLIVNTSDYVYSIDCELNAVDNNQLFGFKYWYDNSIYVYHNKTFAKGAQYSPNQDGYDINITPPTRARYTFNSTDKNLIVESGGNSTTYNFSDFSPLSSIYPFVLFACWTTWKNTLSDYGQGKIYGCQFYKEGVKVADFVPCYRKSDNAAGMYDSVRKQFYTNAGTGNFIIPT